MSPKEVWAIADDQHVVVANIASSVTARNIAQQPKVCLSFVDVLVQKGFKLQGTAVWSGALPCIAQSRRNPVDADVNPALHPLVGPAVPVAADQLDLQVVQRVDVGEAVAD